VAESAVRNKADVEAYSQAGADMVLVGEALVTGDAESLLKQFTSVPKIRL
jgi:indole-3-glycerol phosphate synthase